MTTKKVTCNSCGAEAFVEPRPTTYHSGGPAVTILNVPTIVCRQCETRTYTEATWRALEQLRKEVERPHTIAATVDYAKAAEAWGTPS